MVESETVVVDVVVDVVVGVVVDVEVVFGAQW